jgi:recombination protein RecT
MEKSKAVALLQSDQVKKKFEEVLGTKSKSFVTSVLSAVSSNPALAKADGNSVYMAAMMAAALDLPVNQNLGYAYIVPYGDKAQFQIGVKGLTQLAMRSNQFKTISTSAVYEGQLAMNDPLKGHTFNWHTKKSEKVVGYVAYFQLLNGFEKTIYMTVEDIKKHASKYSKTFNSAHGVWQSDFGAMAEKTVLKRLLSKYAPMSIEMQRAEIADQGVIKDVETLDVDYVDNTDGENEKQSEQQERLRQLIDKSESVESLTKLEKHLESHPELKPIYDAKLGALSL